MNKTFAVLVAASLVAAACRAPEPQTAAKRRASQRTDMTFPDSGWKEEHEEDEEKIAEPEPPAHSVLAPTAAKKKGAFKLPDDGENFVGAHRAIPKTRPAKVPVRTLSLSALLSEFRPGQPKSDDHMRNGHDPPMCKAFDCDRVVEENDNVQVEAWVIAATKESDGDFHLIVAATKQAAASSQPDRWALLNIEVSGLPPAGTVGRPALKHVRQQFRDGFVPPVKESHGYVALEPVHVRVTGSLFYDVDHPAGAVGPGALKPATSWEIHPITDLEVLE